MIDEAYTSDWRRLDGRSAPEGRADLTLAHLSDLHGQLGPAHQVYYDNPHSRPTSRSCRSFGRTATATS